MHDLGVEPLGTPARVCSRLIAPQPVVDVQRGDAEAELAKRVEEARRVRAARDEAQHLTTRLDQVVPADVRLDPAQKLQIVSVTGLSARAGR